MKLFRRCCALRSRNIIQRNVRLISQSKDVTEEFVMKTDYFSGYEKNSWGLVPPAKKTIANKTLFAYLVAFESQEESKTLREIFADIDQNGDNVLQKDEIQFWVLKSNGVLLNEEVVEEICKRTKDGVLHFTDLKASMEEFHVAITKKAPKVGEGSTAIGLKGQRPSQGKYITGLFC